MRPWAQIPRPTHILQEYRERPWRQKLKSAVGAHIAAAALAAVGAPTPVVAECPTTAFATSRECSAVAADSAGDSDVAATYSRGATPEELSATYSCHDCVCGTGNCKMQISHCFGTERR